MVFLAAACWAEPAFRRLPPAPQDIFAVRLRFNLAGSSIGASRTSSTWCFAEVDWALANALRIKTQTYAVFRHVLWSEPQSASTSCLNLVVSCFCRLDFVGCGLPSMLEIVLERASKREASASWP